MSKFKIGNKVFNKSNLSMFKGRTGEVIRVDSYLTEVLYDMEVGRHPNSLDVLELVTKPVTPVILPEELFTL